MAVASFGSLRFLWKSIRPNFLFYFIFFLGCDNCLRSYVLWKSFRQLQHILRGYLNPKECAGIAVADDVSTLPDALPKGRELLESTPSKSHVFCFLVLACNNS